MYYTRIYPYNIYFYKSSISATATQVFVLFPTDWRNTFVCKTFVSNQLSTSVCRHQSLSLPLSLSLLCVPGVGIRAIPVVLSEPSIEEGSDYPDLSRHADPHLEW